MIPSFIQMPRWDVDDDHVDDLIADAKYIAKVRYSLLLGNDRVTEGNQTRQFPLAKCAFFGTDCTDALVVPVVVQVDRAEKNPGRPYHLMFRNYVNTDSSRNSIALNIDRFMIEVENWPANQERLSEFGWTIFVSRHVRLIEAIIYPPLLLTFLNDRF